MTTYQVYTYKEKRYEVLSMGKMKHPTTREWVACVTYRPEGKFELIFTREFREFFERFKIAGIRDYPPPPESRL